MLNPPGGDFFCPHHSKDTYNGLQPELEKSPSKADHPGGRVEGGRGQEEPSMETEMRQVGKDLSRPRMGRVPSSMQNLGSSRHSSCLGYAQTVRADLHRLSGTPQRQETQQGTRYCQCTE